MSRHRKRIGRRALLATAAVAAGAVLVPMTVRTATADTAHRAHDARTAITMGSADATGTAGTAFGAERSPVRALERAAHPLRTTEPGGSTADLRALSAMVGDAEVVGLGEATHGSHEFFTMKQRVFRHLVETKGFTTFALEMSWSGGLRIDDYLQTGEGDARRLAEEVFANSPGSAPSSSISSSGCATTTATIPTAPSTSWGTTSAPRRSTTRSSAG